MADNNAVAQTGQTGLAKLKAMLEAPSVQEQFQNALAETKINLSRQSSTSTTETSHFKSAIRKRYVRSA